MSLTAAVAAVEGTLHTKVVSFKKTDANVYYRRVVMQIIKMLHSSAGRESSPTSYFLPNTIEPNSQHCSTTGLQKLNGRLLFAIIASAFGAAFQHGYNTGVVNAPQTVSKLL